MYVNVYIECDINYFWLPKKSFARLTKGLIPFLCVCYIKMYRFKVSIKYLNLNLDNYLEITVKYDWKLELKSGLNTVFHDDKACS